MTKIVEGKDLRWPFAGEPFYYFDTEDSYGHREYVDPFPCYAHDAGLVREIVDLVYQRAGHFKLAPHTIYLLHSEPKSRTNGWAAEGYSRRNDDGSSTRVPGYVVLAGKRIPPHPAMTRYLVAHEIGHHADYQMCSNRKAKDGGLDDEYAKLRRLTHDYSRYGGGSWHSNVGEMIANDFRILVCGVEEEFWPHPGFDHPRDVEGLQQWWDKNWYESLDK